MTGSDNNEPGIPVGGISTDKLCKICIIVLLGLNLTEGNITQMLLF